MNNTNMLAPEDKYIANTDPLTFPLDDISSCCSCSTDLLVSSPFSLESSPSIDFVDRIEASDPVRLRRRLCIEMLSSSVSTLSVSRNVAKSTPLLASSAGCP